MQFHLLKPIKYHLTLIYVHLEYMNGNIKCFLFAMEWMKETYLPSFLNVSVSAAYLPLISLWNTCCISLWCLFEKHAHTITLNSREYTLFHSVGGKKNWAYTEKDVKTAASGVRVLFFAYRCYMLGAIYLRGFPPLIYVSLPPLKYF